MSTPKNAPGDAAIARKAERRLRQVSALQDRPERQPMLAETAPSGRTVGRPPGLLRALLRHPRAFVAGGLAAAREAHEPLVRDEKYSEAFQLTVAEYLQRYFASSFMRSVTWMGVPALKLVSDLWIYQEILHRTRPDFVVELGSHYGGSTLFIAQMMDLIGHGRVISVDVKRAVYMPDHPRISLVTGDCSDAAVVAEVRALAAGGSVAVLHDADHRSEAVARDLALYAPLVSVGQYLIVEDGIVDLYNPRRYRLRDMEAGPLPAIRAFLAERPDEFVVDRIGDRFILTASPHGYLRRVRPAAPDASDGML